MKSYKLIKVIPLLFIFIIVLVISLNNQKQRTNLTLLIWDTPKTSLATYLAISTLSGFLLSYLFINSLATNSKPRLNRVINYNLDDQNINPSSSENFQKEVNYDQTLIERNYRDPSPTMEAQFRVIGNVNKINRYSSKQESNNSYNSDPLTENEYEEEYETRTFNDDVIRDGQNNNDMDWDNRSLENW